MLEMRDIDSISPPFLLEELRRMSVVGCSFFRGTGGGDVEVVAWDGSSCFSSTPQHNSAMG